MRKNLPIEMLRSFVAIAERGSISLAAKEVCLSQPALSLQMKRLSELTGMPLLDRHFRGVTLTAGGKTLLTYARAILGLNDSLLSNLAGETAGEPIRIGMIQDFADGILPKVLIRFAQSYPEASLQIRVGNSIELAALHADRLLDIAICLADPHDPAALIKPPLLWLGHRMSSFDETLPLVLMENPCRFRDVALSTLTERQIPYRIVMESPNLSVLCSAVNAGIGITCRTTVFLPDRLPILHGLDLPLPNIAVAVHSTPAPSRPMRELVQMMRSAIRSLDMAASLPSPHDIRLHNISCNNLFVAPELSQ